MENNQERTRSTPPPPPSAHIVLAPPMSGCTTLANIYHNITTAVLDVDLAIPSLRGMKLPLDARAKVITAWVHEAMYLRPVICIPVLDDREMESLIEAIVIVPPATLVKRALHPAIGDGHKIAAVAWRDMALAIAARHPKIPVYSALQAVPILQHALGVNGGFVAAS
jgi:hypothetical protein